MDGIQGNRERGKSLIGVMAHAASILAGPSTYYRWAR